MDMDGTKFQIHNHSNEKNIHPILQPSNSNPMSSMSLSQSIHNHYHSAIPLDPSNLVHINETPLTSNLRCVQISPLIHTPGCALLTKQHLYFQPAQPHHHHHHHYHHNIPLVPMST